MIPAQGDFDGDGEFRINDVLQCLLYLSRGRTDRLLDFNGDGKPGIADAIDMLLALLKT